MTTWGGVYSFVLAGDRLWDEGTMLITINAIASDYYFGCAVALSGDTALIGGPGSHEKGDDSGTAYIFLMMNVCMAGGNQDCPRQWSKL